LLFYIVVSDNHREKDNISLCPGPAGLLGNHQVLTDNTPLNRVLGLFRHPEERLVSAYHCIQRSPFECGTWDWGWPSHTWVPVHRHIHFWEMPPNVTVGHFQHCQANMVLGHGCMSNFEYALPADRCCTFGHFAHFTVLDGRFNIRMETVYLSIQFSDHEVSFHTSKTAGAFVYAIFSPRQAFSLPGHGPIHAARRNRSYCVRLCPGAFPSARAPAQYIVAYMYDVACLVER